MRIRTSVADKLFSRFQEYLDVQGITLKIFLTNKICEALGEIRPKKEVEAVKPVGRPCLTAIEKRFRQLIKQIEAGFVWQSEEAEKVCPGSGHLVMSIWEKKAAELEKSLPSAKGLSELTEYLRLQPWLKFHIPNSFPPAYREVYESLRAVKH